MTRKIPYEEETFDDWRRLKECLHSFFPRWVFRGQARAEWSLQSTLERAAHNYEPKDKSNVEQFFLSQFKRRAQNYLSPSLIPEDSNSLEWLALMQHHGAPTRLLDFTKSPYVATYFAIEQAGDNDCAVWAINAGDFWDKFGIRICEKLKHTINLTLVEFQLGDPKIMSGRFDEIFFTEPFIPCVLLVEPYRMNERLTVQQGCFLCPGDPGSSFQENLLTYDPDENQVEVRKLVISSEIRDEALDDLYTMNINRASLFPGIDGFAQSLKHQLITREQEHLSRRIAVSYLDAKMQAMRKLLTEDSHGKSRK